MTKEQEGCVKPAGGPIVASSPEPAPAAANGEGRVRMTARVGREAPDFEASAYAEGGFRNIRLSDYRGKWVTLCFYPGDFTFV